MLVYGLRFRVYDLGLFEPSYVGDAEVDGWLVVVFTVEDTAGVIGFDYNLWDWKPVDSG